MTRSAVEDWIAKASPATPEQLERFAGVTRPPDMPVTLPRSTGRRRRRRRLTLARELDATPLGPDESEVVHSWEDGWTLRRVERLSDQRREGILARHCSRQLTEPLPREHSLRDEDNLPHVTFTAWRLVGAGAVIEQALTAAVSVFLNIELMGENATRALAVVNLYHPGAGRHLGRVREFVTAQPEAFPAMPANPLAAMAALEPYIAQRLSSVLTPSDPRDGWYWELLRRVEEETDLHATVWRG